MCAEGKGAIDLAAVRDAFNEAFARVWHGRMENDGFNKLVLHAGLTAREVIVLRAYCKYLRQARIPVSQASLEEQLARHQIGSASGRASVVQSGCSSGVGVLFKQKNI